MDRIEALRTFVVSIIVASHSETPGAFLQSKSLQSIYLSSYHMYLVGAIGFEPTTPGPPDQCATRLRYAPMIQDLHVRGNVCVITRRYSSVLLSPVAQSLTGSAETAPALLINGAWRPQW